MQFMQMIGTIFGLLSSYRLCSACVSIQCRAFTKHEICSKFSFKNENKNKMIWLNDCMEINTFSSADDTISKASMYAYVCRVHRLNLFNNERDKIHFHDQMCQKNLVNVF